MSRPILLLFVVAACACLVPSLAATQTLPKAQHQMSKAETARLGAKTEARGFLNLARYARQRYAAEIAQLGAQTEARGFLNLAHYSATLHAAGPKPATAQAFHWRDAGIGAAATAGVGLVAVSVGITIRDHGTRMQVAGRRSS